MDALQYTSFMPDPKTVRHVVAIYLLEHGMCPNLGIYICRTLHLGMPDKLPTMTKEEVWGVVDMIARDMERELLEAGALTDTATYEFAKSMS